MAPLDSEDIDDLLASLTEAADELSAAVEHYRESQESRHLAAVATIAFSFLDMLSGAPPELTIGLAASSAVWFRAAAAAWDRPELFELAIELARRATPGELSEDRHLAASLTTLGQSLTDSWEARGGEERLREGLEVLRRAVAIAEADPEDPDRPQILNALAVALLAAEHGGVEVDIKETVGILERVVELMPAPGAARLGHLNNLSGAPRRLAERSGQQAYLDQAIAHFEESIDDAAGNRELTGALHSGLAIALHDRFTLDRLEDTRRAIGA